MNKFYMWLNRLLYITFSFIIPIFIVNARYDLYENKQQYAIKGGFILIAFFLIRFGRVHFRRMINKMKDSYLKRGIEQVFYLLPYGLVYLAILYAESHLANFKFTLKWCFVSMTIAVIFDLLAVYFRDQEAR